MKGKRIKVLIVDDHLMVRKGLALLVSGFKDMQLVGEGPKCCGLPSSSLKAKNRM